MRIVIPALIAVLCASPLSARTDQFDLVCDYGASERTRDGQTTNGEAQPKHLQINIATQQWCEGSCWPSEIVNLTRAEGDVITLKDETFVGFEGTPTEFQTYELIAFDRATGVLTKLYYTDRRGASGTRTKDTNTCEERPFSGLTRSEFKPPHMRNQGRFLRDLNDGEPGKALKKLAFPGNTRVSVRVQVDAEGKALECHADAPSQTAEFDAAICRFMMRKEVSFYPALNPKGEAVQGEYRTTMAFVGD